MNKDDPIVQSWFDATNCYLGALGLKPYVKAPCESLTRNLEVHMRDCEACKGGWSVFDRPESEERYLDSPTHGLADELNRRR